MIIVGSGHNGLTAACYLGAAGRKVLVLERRHVVGGAAVTEEFHPGYRTSVCSYVQACSTPQLSGTWTSSVTVWCSTPFPPASLHFRMAIACC